MGKGDGTECMLTESPARGETPIEVDSSKIKSRASAVPFENISLYPGDERESTIEILDKVERVRLFAELIDHEMLGGLSEEELPSEDLPIFLEGQIRNTQSLLLSSRISEHMQGRTAYLNLLNYLANTRYELEGMVDSSDSSRLEKSFEEVQNLLEKEAILCRNNLGDKGQEMDLEDDLEDILAMSRYKDSIERLSKMETPNSGNLYGFLSEMNNSDDSDDWMRVVNSISAKEQSLLIEAIETNEVDSKLRHIDEVARDNEDRLRDEATICGERPDVEIITIPDRNWSSNGFSEFQDFYDAGQISMISRESSGPLGMCMTDIDESPSKFVFIYSSEIDKRYSENEESDREERICSIVRHELIHQAQKTTDGLPRFSTEESPIRIIEGLTEGMNQIRRTKGAVLDRNPDNVGLDYYSEEVKSWLRILQDTGLNKADKEFLMENLNSRPIEQTNKIMDYLLRSSGSTFKDLWEKYCPSSR